MSRWPSYSIVVGFRGQSDPDHRLPEAGWAAPAALGPQGVRVALLLACTLAVYVPVFGAGYLWDDDIYVRSNSALRSLSGLWDIWRIPPTTRQYYPVTYTSFWLEYRIWGDGPLGYHVVNLVLHAANALLVWRLLAALEVPAAFAAGLLFAVHPVHVESVAWIAERKNVLSGLFALLATGAWVRFLAERQRRQLVLAGLAFGAALFSKTQVCTLPAILLLLAWWKRPGEWRRFILPLLPLVALGVVAAVITVACEPGHQRAVVAMPDLSPAARVVVAGRALWFYAASLLWPRNLMAVYGGWTIEPDAYTAYVPALGAAALLALAWVWRARVGRGPFVALAAFGLSLAPVLGLVDFNFLRFAFVADHFQYLASIPLIALATAAVARALAAGAQRVPATSGAGRALLAGLVAVLGVGTWQRATVHRGEEALWRDNIARDPHNSVTQYHLGNVLLAQGRHDEAAAAFAAAAQTNPRFAAAYNNWGDALREQGRFDEAADRYARVLALNPADPIAHTNLGIVAQRRGQAEAAMQHFRDATERDPDDALARELLAGALMALGRGEDAAVQLQAAVRLDPTRFATQRDLGVLLLNLQRVDAAIAVLSAAAQLDPSAADVQHHLGAALGMAGRLSDALRHLTAAARLSPSDAEIQNHWGVALTLAGRREEAAQRFNEALRLRPDYDEARTNLAHLSARDVARPGYSRPNP